MLPDLGEIPPADPRPIEEDEEDEEDDEEDDDDEADDSDDEGTRRRRRRGPRGTAAITKRQGKDDAGQKGDDAKPRKKRGRPPKVDTPMEARINAILKGLRRIKAPNGEPLLRQFLHLPDKADHPDYYVQIKELMAIEVIKVRVSGGSKRRLCTLYHLMLKHTLMYQYRKSRNVENISPSSTS